MYVPYSAKFWRVYIFVNSVIFYGRGIQALPVYLTRTAPLAHCCLLKLTALSQAIPTSKVSRWKEFLADSADYPRDIVHQCSCSQSMKTVLYVKIFP